MAEGDFNVKAIISADTKNFDNGMKKAQTSATNLSNTFGNLSKVITKALSFVGLTAGVKAITDFGKASVKAAEDANRALNILNNTLKVTGATAWTTSEEMVEMSKKIAGSTNYTVGEIQDMQSVLLGFKNITEDTFESASVAITDMATVMGMDLKSAVQTVGKALDDPIKGLDSLKRQGFAFTDQQKEEMKVLVENGKILEAQNMILSELNTTYGGAAVAAQSSFDKQRDAMIELKETLGNQLLPIMEQWAGESAKTFGKLTELVQKIDFASIAAGLEIAADTIKEVITNIWGNFKELFSALDEVFGDGESLFDSWKQAAWDNFNQVYRIVQDVVQLVTAIIKGDWSTAWGYAKLTILRMVDAALDSFSKLLNAFPKLVNGLISGLNEIIKGINVVREFFDMEKIDIIKPFEKIDLSALTGVENKIKETEKEIEKATGKAADKALKDIDKVSERRRKYVKESKKDNLDLYDSASTTIENTTNSWLKYFEDIKKKADDWTDTIKNSVSTVYDAFSEMFVMLGENLVGAGHGFEDFASVALDALSDVLKALSAQLAALAVVKALSYDYASAAIAAAGAAAALVASGVASGVSKALAQTEQEVNAVGDAADKAGNSLDYFLKRLNDIKNGVTTTSRMLAANVKQYRDLTKALKAERSAKYEEIEAERKRILEREREIQNEINYYKNLLPSADPYNTRQSQIKKLTEELEALRKPLKDLEQEYNDLTDAYKEARKQSQQITIDVLNSYKEQVKENKTLTDSYKDIYKSLKDYYTLYEEWNKMSAIDQAADVVAAALGKLDTYTERLTELRRYVEIILNEQAMAIQESLIDVYETIIYSGKTIGENLVNSIIDGGTKKDFLTSMKNYIRENLVKLAVYTESFQNKLAKIGSNLTAALMGGGEVTSIRTELENLWDEASQNVQKVESVIADAFGDLDEVIEETSETIEVAEENLNSFEKAMKSFFETINDLGSSIANVFTDSLSKGLGANDFLLTFKDWIKNFLIQSIVYTESMKDKIVSLGEKIKDAILGKGKLSNVKNEVKELYKTLQSQSENIQTVLDDIFGTTAEEISESIDTIEEKLTSFEQAMKSFKESISDLGGDLANTLVNGITNGLSQSDFLDDMKKWVRKMLVQSVVYTESMKAEIEAIGAAISKGISEGFTETTFHEIRRDLSWVFEQANRTMENIDGVLNSVFGSGYATGTNNATSGLHLVGEAGPELVKFRGGEQVLNAGNTQKALSGIGNSNTFNVTFQNTKDTTAYAMMQQLKSYNRQMAINGII